MTDKLGLDVGGEYNIRLYPREEIVSGRYVGDNKTHYLFECTSDKGVVLVSKYWACLEKEVVTHIPISSSPVIKGRVMERDE